MKKLLTLILLASFSFSKDGFVASDISEYFEDNGLILLLIDPNTGKIIKGNKSAEKFYGYSKSKLQSMKIQNINQFTQQQVKEEIIKAKKEKRNHFIFRHKLANGKIKKVEVYSHPFMYEGKKILLSTIYDVSRNDLLQQTIEHYSATLEEQVEIKTRENTLILVTGMLVQFLIIFILIYINIQRKITKKNLRKLNHELHLKIEDAIEENKKQNQLINEQSKNATILELLFNLSHHWRQPLNVMSLSAQNIVDTLKYDDWTIEEIEEMADHIVTNSRSLSGTISKLTEFYEENETNHLFTLSDSIELSKGFLSQPNITLQTNIKEEKILCDRKALVEVFINLLQNSIDAAYKEGLKIPTILIHFQQVEEIIILEISDNCGGIDESIIDKIFEPYTTTEFKNNNKGLGLYITKSIVEYRLKGSISAKNRDNGATFTIRFRNGE
ncbi:MAG: PAS domain-containing sensor histidine kinase [Campylobacterales bacterium]|nr:PAS domain-containing sensor histidine kinase [Campylobacterales bacterium]